MAGGAFRDAGLANGLLDRALDDGFVQVMTPELSGLAGAMDSGGREDPLPGSLAAGRG